ncbi:hypothetical protein FHW69_002161 [Luteibacter sp. Sphag1AF]|uniref:DUF4879 domain-containing protein n=1 Tax=Luteibacter sp. Sphag1AF TaxID=2587031 RepID=UPI001610CCF7|nr:DUF4879 domain-containing protein [Luteibacter sp. Sphag1AF]MBB3227538.1 hypothetical protein [Luteibacter sp. Sphag1AF]
MKKATLPFSLFALCAALSPGPTQADQYVRMLDASGAPDVSGLYAERSSASTLTSAHVVAVHSAQGGNEVIPPGAWSTQQDHGGANMTIITEEIGYGRFEQASLLSNPLREVRREPLCDYGAPAPCNGRGTIVGYRRHWNASGFEGGNFQFTVYPNSNGGGSVQSAFLTIR